MGRRTAAIGAAMIMSTGAVAATADAAGGPPLPTGVGGATVKLFATGTQTPTSFAFGNGAVFEGDGGNSQSSGPPNGGVNVLKGGKTTAVPSSLMFVGGVAWQKGALYVSGGQLTSPTSATWTIQKWTGWNGTKFAHQKAIWTAPKGLDGLNGIAFGPDGRLYVGVDLGLTDGNDHGPAKTPDVYDILSMKANGKGVKVFAKGIRQPWQLAFPKGSTSPLVSDLGQDSGATNPPDFILKPKAGDNFGFPKCNRTAASKCKGFAKPFKTFGPHMDPMGMAIIGKTLYFTSFQGPHGAGPGGEVFSMPVKGGAVKPVVKGFVAPIVGLAAHGGNLYVGALSSQVFTVKP